MVPQAREIVTAEVAISQEDLFTERHYETLKGVFFDRPDIDQIVVVCPLPATSLCVEKVKENTYNTELYELCLVLDMNAIKQRLNVKSVMENLDLVIDDIMVHSVENIKPMVRYH